MENVKGFESSQAREIFVKALSESNFYYREFILTPLQLGIPNTRHRYYCIARKHNDFSFAKDKIYDEIPLDFRKKFNKASLGSFLDRNVPAEYYLKIDELSKRIWVLDIVTSTSNYAMCFTKAYTHYYEGTGSVFSELDQNTLRNTLEELKSLEDSVNNHSEEDYRKLRNNLLEKLRIRFFTPTEIARLMCFPAIFTFPESTTEKQKYRLLGNSVNVRVVGELIKVLCSRS